MKAFTYSILFGAVLATPLRYKPEACECVPNVRCPMVFPQSCECMAKAREECQAKLPSFCPRPAIDESCANGAETPSAGDACDIVGGKLCSADEICNGSGTCVKKDDPIEANREGCNVFGAPSCPTRMACGSDGVCLAESEALEQTCGTEGSAHCPNGWKCHFTVDPTVVADVPGKCKPVDNTPTGTAPTQAATSLVPFPTDTFTALPPVEPSLVPFPTDTFTALPPVEPSLVPFPTDPFPVLPPIEPSLVPFPTDTFTALPPFEPCTTASRPVSLAPFPTDTFTALPLSELLEIMAPQATPLVNY